MFNTPKCHLEVTQGKRLSWRWLSRHHEDSSLIALGPVKGWDKRHEAERAGRQAMRGWRIMDVSYKPYEG